MISGLCCIFGQLSPELSTEIVEKIEFDEFGQILSQ
jgi:hypothetical protein